MSNQSLFVTIVLALLVATELQGSRERVSAQAPATTARVEFVSSVDVPLMRAEQGWLTQSAGARGPGDVVKGISLAADETGDLYLAYSVYRDPLRSEPRLIKCDSNGRLLFAFKLPAAVRSSRLTVLSSVVCSGDSVYVPAAWVQDGGPGQGAILVFGRDGSYRRMIKLPPRFSPRKVLVTARDEFYVLGLGSRLVNGQSVYSGSNMILKLSGTGRILASFSPFPAGTNEETRQLIRHMRQSYLLLDEAGRIIHILPDATIRVFDLDGRLEEVLPSPSLMSFDSLEAAFLERGSFVLATVDFATQQTVLTVVSRQGKVVSYLDTSGRPLIRFAGEDGYYYSVSHLPLRGSEGVRVRISKARLELVE